MQLVDTGDMSRNLWGDGLLLDPVRRVVWALLELNQGPCVVISVWSLTALWLCCSGVGTNASLVPLDPDSLRPVKPWRSFRLQNPAPRVLCWLNGLIILGPRIARGGPVIAIDPDTMQVDN